MNIQKSEGYLNGKIFVGIVENNIDPKRKGRLKIRVQGVFEDIYQDIDRSTFNKIVDADPTSKIDGKLYMGKCSKWLRNKRKK